LLYIFFLKEKVEFENSAVELLRSVIKARMPDW